jgi:signal transduction histidine kinase
VRRSPAGRASGSHARALTALRSQVRSLRRELLRARGLATLGTMTAMVAHEFNNILTPIVNYAQMARLKPDLTQKAVWHAAEGGRRAGQICDAILGLARHGSDQKEPLAILPLVRETVAAMARDPVRDGIELDIDVPPDLVAAGRRAELQQVILNLLLNARQAVLNRPGARRIEVCGKPSGRFVSLTVSDNGAGIPRKDLSHIFEPFFTAQADGKGTGLGLAFCRQVTRGLGGRITARSREGEGATFTLAIPRPENESARKRPQSRRLRLRLEQSESPSKILEGAGTSLAAMNVASER